MNKSSLVKIINKEIAILSDFIEGFGDSDDINPMEVDMALSKVQDIYDELQLLKNDTVSGSINKENLAAPAAKKVKNPLIQETNSEKVVVLEKKLPIANTQNIEEEKTEPELQEPAEIEPESAVSEEHVEKNEEEEPIIENSSAAVEVEVENEEVLEVKEGLVVNEVETSKIEPVETEIKEAIVDQDNLPNDEVEPEPALNENKELETQYEVSGVEDEKQEEVIEKPKDGILADQFSKDKPSVNDILAGVKKNKDLASLLKDSPISDLRKAIKLNDRIWYINELFGKNSSIYDKTIEKINASDNLDEALEYLFTTFKWNQERKSTISFLELVFRRFAQN